jgi:hypothetical protein
LHFAGIASFFAVLSSPHFPLPAPYHVSPVHGPRPRSRQPPPSFYIPGHGCCGCVLEGGPIVAYQCSPWDHPPSSCILVSSSVPSVLAQLHPDPAAVARPRSFSSLN